MNINVQKVLITGGAGFVGSNLAILLKQHYFNIEVIAFDNLRRRGSELNIERLKRTGIQFIHGDIRCWPDLDSLPSFDLLIDCSAEPSVHSGINSSPLGTIDNNLIGTINCIEISRRNGAAFLFLSTSRVYPILKLDAIPFQANDTRFYWTDEKSITGFSTNGISENFSLDGARSVYGATKLAGELILQEYSYSHNMPVIINRCSIIAGPWQMGKVDQGVAALWVACHAFKNNLRYIGYGGNGKQVRDFLHIEDLYNLLILQIQKISSWDASIYNIGGGNKSSASLKELTSICRSVTDIEIPISSEPETSSVDIRIFITDSRKAFNAFNWEPAKNVKDILTDIFSWLKKHEELTKKIFIG